MRRAELTSSAAVEEVDAKPNGQPDKEAQPCHDRQPGHQQYAEEDAEHRKHWPTGTAEATMSMRIFVAQNQHARRYQHKGEECTDIRQIGECSDIEQSSRQSNDKSRDPRRDSRSPILRMYFREDRREQAVARHGKPYSGLTD